jgi:hypothetical protein
MKYMPMKCILEMHVREMPAAKIYTCEIHFHDMHAYEIYDHKVHAHETPAHCALVAPWPKR